MRRFYLFGALVGALSLLLSACGLAGSGGGQANTPAPEAVFTSAAKTAEALRVERFAQTATLPVESVIATTAFDTPTSTPLPTEAPEVAASPTLSTPATPEEAKVDKAEFVADISVPDGTVLAPGQSFQKIWRINNAGKTTWTTDYSLVYIDGELMGAQPAISLPTTVEPGANVDVTVDMVAPSDTGSYKSFWELRNAEGKIFGFGANSDEAIWVDVSVESGLASTSSGAETPAAGGAVASVSLSVDNAQVSSGCPHTFVFTAQIALNKPSTLGYSLEVGSLSGAEIRLPPPALQNLGAGVHPVVYEVSVPSDVSAWARLHVTEPAQAFSNQVNFSLTCG